VPFLRLLVPLQFAAAGDAAGPLCGLGAVTEGKGVRRVPFPKDGLDPQMCTLSSGFTLNTCLKRFPETKQLIFATVGCVTVTIILNLQARKRYRTMRWRKSAPLSDVQIAASATFINSGTLMASVQLKQN